MLIDGNDDRGIDVGIMLKEEYRIVRMLSHVDDKDDEGIVFSRDCAEYEIKTPQGTRFCSWSTILRARVMASLLNRQPNGFVRLSE